MHNQLYWDRYEVWVRVSKRHASVKIGSFDTNGEAEACARATHDENPWLDIVVYSAANHTHGLRLAPVSPEGA